MVGSKRVKKLIKNIFLYGGISALVCAFLALPFSAITGHFNADGVIDTFCSFFFLFGAVGVLWPIMEYLYPNSEHTCGATFGVYYGGAALGLFLKWLGPLSDSDLTILGFVASVAIVLTYMSWTERKKVTEEKNNDVFSGRIQEIREEYDLSVKKLGLLNHFTGCEISTFSELEQYWTKCKNEQKS